MIRNTKYLLAFALVWTIGSTYWYTCNIKYLCEAKKGAQKVLINNTWNELQTKPLTVYFGPNSDNIITVDVENKLKDVANYLKNNKTAKINITGHTNYHKNVPYTEKLGLERAAKLKALLVSMGANGENISITSKGQRETVMPEGDENAEKMNRRAVINIIK